MHNDGVEEGESPVDRQAQDHDVDQEGHYDVLQKHRLAFNEFAGPEGVEESLGKIGDRIVFQAD